MNTLRDKLFTLQQFLHWKKRLFFVIRNVEKESECAKTLSKNRFIIKVQILSLHSE
jgi:hypothetical protein